MAPRPRSLAAAALVLLAVACQPVDEGELDGQPAPGGEAATDPVGSPQESLPTSLTTLLAQHQSTAAQWQAGAQVAEIVVELDDEHHWRAVSVLYLAPDADRFLLLEVDGDGMRQQRPTLDGLELAPVPGEALEQLPEPELLLDPTELLDAAEETLDACNVDGGPVTIVYATGAPAAWDGRTWTEPMQWRATISGEGAGAVDPTTGEPASAQPCVAG